MANKNLRRIKVSNFLSFNKEPQEMFFTAETKYSSSSSFRCDLIPVSTNKKESILPVTVLYGANASGKSNFFKIFKILNKILNRTDINPNSKLPYKPFDANIEPVCFELEFVINDVIYKYTLQYSLSEIIHEELSTFNSNNSLKRLYTRSKNDVRWHKDLTTITKNIKNEVKERLATRKDVTILEILNLRNIEPYAASHEFLSQSYSSGTAKKLFYNPLLKNRVLSFLKHADVGIIDLKIEKMPEQARVDLLKKIGKFDITESDVSDDIFYFPLFKHNGIKKQISLSEESLGTKEYLEILTDIIPMFLEDGGIFIADELGANLHPLLMKEIITMFHDKRINRQGAQLIVTSHDIALMSKSILNRDEIWFIEKDPEKGESILYPLSHFNDIRNSYDFKIGYLEGRFGGIPYLSKTDTLANLLQE